MTEDDLAELYRRHGYSLFRRCFTYLGEEAAAQDAVQEVFVRALRGAGSFRGEADPGTWLARIADHHCLDLVRRRRKSPIDPRAPETVPDERSLIAGDEPDALVAAHRMMEALDPASRRLAMLYFVDEMTQDEIARETGISRKTIGKRLRALGDWARALEGGLETP